jgi:hypothetical protein
MEIVYLIKPEIKDPCQGCNQNNNYGCRWKSCCDELNKYHRDNVTTLSQAKPLTAEMINDAKANYDLNLQTRKQFNENFGEYFLWYLTDGGK